MKKGKRLLALAVALVVFSLGAFLLNLSNQRQEETAVDETEATVVFSADTDGATALSYTLGGETVALSKKDDAWVYAPRESFPLEQSSVSSMLSVLKEVTAARTVAETLDNAADYGLSAPALTIALTAGDETQTLYVGDKNASTGDYYARAEGQTTVYTIGSDVYNAFDQTLMELMTDEAFPTIDSASVTSFELKVGDDAQTYVYRADGDASAYTGAFTWFDQASDGALTPVNADAMDDYLTSATGVTYVGVVSDTKDDLAAYGLDEASATAVTLHYTEEVTESQADAERAAEQAAATPSPAPAATPAPVVGALRSALAEDAEAVPTEEPTATPSPTPTATPEPTVTVERSLTLWLGGTDENGYVYMTHSKTDRVFRIASTAADALREIDADSLRIAAVLSLTKADVTAVDATANGITKRLAAVQTESTDDEGTVTITTSYTLDGEELSTSLYNSFFTLLNGLEAEAYTDAAMSADAEATFAATLRQSRAGHEELTLALYPYDSSFYQARVNGDETRLINKRDVEDLLARFDALVQTAPSPTPSATPESTTD